MMRARVGPLSACDTKDEGNVWLWRTIASSSASHGGRHHDPGKHDHHDPGKHDEGECTRERSNGAGVVKATHGLTIVTALEEGRVGRRLYESCHQKWRAPSKKQEPGFTRVVKTFEHNSVTAYQSTPSQWVRLFSSNSLQRASLARRWPLPDARNLRCALRRATLESI